MPARRYNAGVIQGPAESHDPLELAPESDPGPQRFRTVPPRESDQPTPEKTRPDFFTRFMDQPRWEQYTAAAALASLLGWAGASGWNQIFSFGSPGGWFFTFTLFGSTAVIALAVAGTGPSGWMGMSEKTRLRTLACFAALPALGGGIELLQNFWAAIALVAAGGMAYAAYRLVVDDEQA